MLRLVLVVTTVWPLIVSAADDPCQPPCSRDARVRTTVSFDPATKLYTYRRETTSRPVRTESVESPDPPAIVDVEFPPGAVTRSVGPKAQPENVNAEILIARLQDDLWESFKLCWITDAQPFNELTHLADQSAEWLGHGAPSDTRHILEQFLGALNFAGKEKSTEEALGLLSLDAEMIRQRIVVVPPPPLHNVKVEASVAFDPATRIYTYRYRITNPLENLLPVSLVSLDITLPANAIPPRGSSKLPAGPGFDDPARPLDPMGTAIRGVASEAQFYRQMSGLDYVPVALFSPPARSDTSPGSRSSSVMPTDTWDLLGSAITASWYGTGPTDGALRILPGDSVDGFSLTSFGSPGVRRMELQPDIVNLLGQLPEEFWTTEDDSGADLIAKERTYRCFGILTWTVGPTALPVARSNLELVRRLGALVEECIRLHWLTDGVFARELTDVVAEAEAAATKNDAAAARALLEKFAFAVTSASPARRSREAADLLSFNARDVLDNWIRPPR